MEIEVGNVMLVVFVNVKVVMADMFFCWFDDFFFLFVLRFWLFE